MYALIVAMARALVRGWYRCEHYGPPLAAGPLVLIGNHSNGLVDGGMMALLTRRPLRFVAKIGLMRMPVLGWIIGRLGAIPIFRPKDGEGTEQNERSFSAAYDALDRGEIVVLFPEGTSHSDPRLRPFKTGAARIALGAEARRGFTARVRVQPVALHYQRRGAFRSRVQTLAGEPIDLTDLAESAQRDARAAARELTDRLEAALATLLPDLADPRQRALLWLAESLLPPDGSSPPERRARLARSLQALDPGRRRALVARLDALDRDLARAGMGPDLDAPAGIWRCLGLTLGTGLALLPWLVPVLIAQAIAGLAPLPADKHVSAWLLASWVLLPLWFGVLVALAALGLGRTGAVAVGATALAAGALLPRSWEAWVRSCRVPGSRQRGGEELRKRARELGRDLSRLP